MSAITAAEKVAPAVHEKKDEKAEKRRALGRGLESLLPGPRAVVTNPESQAAGRERGEESPGNLGHSVPGGGKPVPHFGRNDKSATGLHASGSAAVATALQVSSAPEERPGEAISAEGQTTQHTVNDLNIELIDPNPYQTRYVFQEEMLRELADSIQQNGVVQPVVVRPAEEPGRYVLVLGERRLRASKMAGLTTIPAMVRRLSPQQAAEMTVLENVQRQDLNPLEQAEAFRVLSKQFNLTQAQIAERIGVSRETVANYMRLLRLPQDVMKYMLDGQLSFSDARAILALDHEEHMRIVAKEVVTRHLKWDQIEERVRELNGFGALQNAEGAAKASGARWMDPNVRSAQMEVERILGMRVRIKDRNGKGRIVIEYATLDEYERVVQLLSKK